MESTLSRKNLWRSVKKFWKDASSYPVYFDNDFMIDRKENQYLIVNIDGIHIAQLSNGFMTVFVFSKKDAEGELLTATRDYVIDRMEPGYFDLYNTEVSPWVKIGGVILSEFEEVDGGNVPTGTKTLMIRCLMQWGAKI